MNNWILRSCAALVLLALPALASADWSDSFDTYANGSGLHGQGGWESWDGAGAADAFVTNVQSNSAPHSVDITPTSDIVHPFSGHTAGQWILSAMQYIPTAATGVQYLIILNDYATGGPYAWSLDLQFDADAGTVSAPFEDPGGNTLPISRGRWVEVRVEIDLTADTQRIVYDGTELVTINYSQGGFLEIAALDLFSDGGSSIYYDDCCLLPPGSACPPATPVESTSWGQIKSVFK